MVDSYRWLPPFPNHTKAQTNQGAVEGNNKYFWHMPNQAASIRLELQDIQCRLALQPGDLTLRDMEKSALAKLISLNKAEEGL